jgi:D-alanyl-D-alanine carboxypeptidase
MATSTLDPELEEQKNDPTLSEREAQQMEDWYSLPSVKKNTGEPVSAEDLAEKEESSTKKDPDRVGKGYSASGDAGSAATGITSASAIYSKVLGSKKKKGAAAFAAAIVASLIIMLTLFLPAKLLFIMNNLQDRFYSASADALDKETDRLVSNYLKGKAAAWKKDRCGGKASGKIIDQSCRIYTPGKSLVQNLFSGWSDGKLEDKLLKQYGIAFAIRDGGKTFMMEFHDNNGKQIDFAELTSMLTPDNDATIDDILRGNSSWTQSKKNQYLDLFERSLAHETRYKRVFIKMKVARLLERKYATKMCVFGCFGLDRKANDYSDWKENKKRAFKIKVAERILVGKFEMYQYLYKCIMDESCTPDDFTKPDPMPYEADAFGCAQECDLNGEPRSKYDNEARSQLAKRVLSYLDNNPEAAKKLYDQFQRNGFFSSFVSNWFKTKITKDDLDGRGKAVAKSAEAAEAIAKAGGKVAKVGARAIPIIGEIDTAASLVNGVETVRTAAPKMAYVMNATAVANFWQMSRTSVDEAKDGSTDAALIGSVVSSFGPGVQIDATEKNQVGGLAGAEQSPLYGSLIGNTKTNTKFASSSFSLPFIGKALAAPTHHCQNGSSVPSGSLICSEEAVQGNGNLITEDVNALTDSSPSWKLLTTISKVWVGARNTLYGTLGGALSGLFGFIGSIVCPDGIVGYLTGTKIACALAGFVADQISNAAGDVIKVIAPFAESGLAEAVHFIIDKFFGYNVDLIPIHMSGSKAFNLAAAGADVTGNESAHYLVGGRELSTAEVAVIVNDQAQKRYQEYKNQSFFARMFDDESEYSPVSKVAMAMPYSKTEAVNSVSAKISSPFHTISSMFGALLKSPAASAERPVNVIPDPFGVTQYGYPANDPSLKMDPDKFWTTYCVSKSAPGAVVTIDNSNSDPAFWSLPKLYNAYSSQTLDDAYTPVNNAPTSSTTDSLNPLSNKADIVKALLKISPMGTNRCALIQAAVGSAGAIFTDDVLTADEKSSLGGATPSTNPLSPSPTGGSVNLNGTNQTTTQCDPRTNDIGTYQGYSNEQPVQIRICSLPNLPCGGEECTGAYGITKADGHALVNAAASTAFYNLVEAGNAALPANLKLSSNSSFRTMAHQQSLCSGNTQCSGKDYIAVAKPGTSNHQMGLAIDFDIKGINESRDSCTTVAGVCTASGHQDWQWLTSNSGRFGLKQYVNEFWHFSPSGN